VFAPCPQAFLRRALGPHRPPKDEGLGGRPPSATGSGRPWTPREIERASAPGPSIVTHQHRLRPSPASPIKELFFGPFMLENEPAYARPRDLAAAVPSPPLARDGSSLSFLSAPNRAAGELAGRLPTHGRRLTNPPTHPPGPVFRCSMARRRLTVEAKGQLLESAPRFTVRTPGRTPNLWLRRCGDLQTLLASTRIVPGQLAIAKTRRLRSAAEA